MSKIPYKKERKVKRAKKKFDRKMKRNKAANRFYAEELIGDGEIIEREEKDREDLKEKIKLDLLKREKRKDDLYKFADRKFSDYARVELEDKIRIEKIEKEIAEEEKAKARALVQIREEETKKRLEREASLIATERAESGDNED